MKNSEMKAFCKTRKFRTNIERFILNGELHTIGPSHVGYYSAQPTMQGLGKLNDIAPMQDAQYATQQRLNKLLLPPMLSVRISLGTKILERIFHKLTTKEKNLVVTFQI
ncbi:hypothetical protein M9H77_05070 [Catharanthus roseus]|uniref:Uncharacterized protein n=1 Tax=Catharanthus roseus TaxID=4058 RepID=A0ACC0CFV0_CATRO|nr:hypothetical protein M9H77_05070 [Catharanthus roseus]